MKTFKYLVLSLAFLVAINAAFSQEDVLRPHGKPKKNIIDEAQESTPFPFIIGLEGGLNYNMFSQTLTWGSPVPKSIYNAYANGSGLSPFFSIIADFNLNKQIGLQLKLSYDNKKFKNDYTGIADAYTELGERADATVKREFENTGSYLGLSAQLRYNLTDQLFIIAGPLVQIPIGNFDQTETESILSPGFYYNQPGKPTIISVNSTLSNVKTRIGFELGIGYKVNITKTIFLVPQARFQIMPTKLTDDELGGIDNSRILFGTPTLTATDKTLNSFQFAVALWFQL
ncbi:MAG: outer membrane beta-barrel protein [Candidatus Kapabacteria bacterium]|nr:outer membrane beta-barrel protein [Candidatus Kapabacteria bacterium]